MARKKTLPPVLDSKIFETVFELSPISTQVFSPTGETLAVNRAWERLFGVTLQEITHYNILQDPQLLAAGLMPLYQKGFAGQVVTIPLHPYEPKQTVTTAKAKTRWLQNIIYPITNEQGYVIQVVMQHQDLTEQKIIEEKLRQNEERLRAILEHSTDAITLLDATGRRVYSTPSRKNVLGYDTDDDIGQSVFTNIHPDDASAVYKAFQNIQTIPNQTDTMEFRIKHKNGDWIWIEAVGTNLLHVPCIESVVVNYRDVTHRKTAEVQLRESEAKFRQLFESNIIGVFISDYAGKFSDGNDAFLSIIGYSREELRSGKIHRDDLTPKELRYISKRAVTALQEVGSSKTYEKVYIHKSGRLVPVLIAVTRIGHDICMGFVLDISERKELEKRKDDFISMASHELKTPITSMKIYVQALARQRAQAGDTDSVAKLEKLDMQIDKLTRLVQELLDVSKINAGKLALRLEPFAFDMLVKEMVETIATTAPNNIVVSGQSKHRITADRDRIGQVILNLLTNAVKYSPPSADIIVRVWENGHYLNLSVQDFGRGIPKEQQTKIFERFYQVTEPADKTFPGLGMGLYISHEIIRLHRGTLTVESERGHGATFTISLPNR